MVIRLASNFGFGAVGSQITFGFKYSVILGDLTRNDPKGECDSLTGSHLISSFITAACSNLNEESRVSPTLASRGVA